MSCTIDWSRADWRKSSRSGNAATCVEVATVRETIGIRDSKHPHSPVLEFTPAEWTAFVSGVKAVKFDALT